jgi:predicted nuclease with TOPRIM domain
MNKENRERLEDLRANDAQLQEENNRLKEMVQMYDQRMAETKKKLETYAKLLPFLKKQFDEFQDSLIAVITDWENHRV